MSASTSVGSAPAADAGARQARLAVAVSRLRTRAASADVERWLLIGGGILLPLGLLMIFLGWQGASNTPRLFEQIPYMISGGLLGLGLVFFGGFLYFAYWMTKLVQENRTHSARLADALERLEQRIAATAVASAEPLSRNGTGGTAPANALVATANGSMYHRPECTVVTGRDGLRKVSADDPGFKPCSICQPELLEA